MFKSVPIGSLLTLPGETWRPYVKIVLNLPLSLQDLIFSQKTGAYLRGLLKNFNIAPEEAPKLAFIVLLTTVGERTLPQLASVLSTELKLPNDKAQTMALEIEKELFAPVMLELNTYLTQQKKGAGGSLRTPLSSPIAPTGGARNVLDLKNQPRQPLPPPLPR